jgi:hypothetical protein
MEYISIRWNNDSRVCRLFVKKKRTKKYRSLTAVKSLRIKGDDLEKGVYIGL